MHNIEIALKIGDQLLEVVDQTKLYTDIKEQCISYGISGVSLFLIELYRQTDHEKYLTLAEALLKNISLDTTSYNYGLYSGKMGIAFTFLKLYKVSGNLDHLQQGLTIAKQCKDGYGNEALDDNSLEGGRAGIVLVLLHLYVEAQEKWLLDYAIFFVEKIIDQALIDETGIFWERSKRNIRGPYNLSEGTSGIGFMFMELAHFFKCVCYAFLAHQTLSYGKGCWDDDINNWADYRKEIKNEFDHNLHKSKYLEGNYIFFTGVNDNITWEFGAVGNAIVSLRSLELFNDSGVKPFIDQIKEKLINKDINSLTSSLSGEYVGRSLFFIDLFKFSRDADYLHRTTEILQGVSGNVLRDLAGGEDNISLFHGLSGIGYLNLMLSVPNENISLFPPRLNTNLSSHSPDMQLAHSTIMNVRERLLSTIFPVTIKVIKAIAPDAFFRYANYDLSSDSSELDFFKLFVNRSFEKIIHHHKEDLKEIFLYEIKKYEKSKGIKSNALLYMADLCEFERLEDIFALDDDSFENTVLTISKNIEIVNTKRDWIKAKSIDSENILNFLNKSENESHTLLIRFLNNFTIEEWLPEEELFILNCFLSPISIKAATSKLLAFCKTQDLAFFRHYLGYIQNINDTFFERLEKNIQKSISHLLSQNILCPYVP